MKFNYFLGGRAYAYVLARNREGHRLVCNGTGRFNKLAVFTDGLQRLVLDFKNRSPHQPFFQSLFASLNDADSVESLRSPFRDFLGSESVNARTDDDKTLVLARRMP